MKIDIGNLEFTDEHKKAINDVLESGRITEGKYVKLFEEKIKEIVGVKHAIAVTNGTVALQLVSQYLGNGLTVCIPAMTFPATMNAFLITGQECMLCDVGADMQIDIDTLSEKDKQDIDVIVPVHLMGYPAMMDYILKEAEKYNWIVVEDAAEAFGASFQGKRVGSFGDFATFSFYVSHNIWGGELGVIVTNDDKAAEVMRSMKNHGRAGDPMKFLHKYVGSNYKTTEFCAALAYVNLLHVEELLEKRYKNAEYFEAHIDNDNLSAFPVDRGFSPLGYPIEAKSEKYRTHICKKLNSKGIETRDIFPALNKQEAYAEALAGEKFNMAEKLEKMVFYIGVHQFLSEKDLKYVVSVLNGDKDD